MDIEAEAKRINREINAEIMTRCRGIPMIAWIGTAERVIEERLDTDRWEYLIAEIIGGVPRFIVTKYTPERFDHD